MDIISDDALTSLHSKDKFLPFASAITAAALTAYAFYRRYYQESLNGIPSGLRGIPAPTATLPYAGKYNDVINKNICSKNIFNSCVFDIMILGHLFSLGDQPIIQLMQWHQELGLR